MGSHQQLASITAHYFYCRLAKQKRKKKAILFLHHVKIFRVRFPKGWISSSIRAAASEGWNFHFAFKICLLVSVSQLPMM